MGWFLASGRMFSEFGLGRWVERKIVWEGQLHVCKYVCMEIVRVRFAFG